MQWSQLFAPADRTLPAMLTRQAERFAQRPLVSCAATRHGPTPTHARLPHVLPAHCNSPAFRHGDRVAIICSNRIEFLEVVLGCAWLGAIAVPINVASRGPQLQHILSNCGARLLVMEAAYAENLTMLNPRELAIETIWLIGATADVRIGDIALRLTAAGGRADRGRSGAARRSIADPLHVRHHRPVEGRVLSTGTILLVGRQYGITVTIAY